MVFYRQKIPTNRFLVRRTRRPRVTRFHFYRMGFRYIGQTALCLPYRCRLGRLFTMPKFRFLCTTFPNFSYDSDVYETDESCIYPNLDAPGFANFIAFFYGALRFLAIANRFRIAFLVVKDIFERYKVFNRTEILNQRTVMPPVEFHTKKDMILSIMLSPRKSIYLIIAHHRAIFQYSHPASPNELKIACYTKLLMSSTRVCWVSIHHYKFTATVKFIYHLFFLNAYKYPFLLKMATIKGNKNPPPYTHLPIQ